jgi:hypothetical protein
VAETNPRDALIVPRDTSELSESTRAWLDALPLVNTPADVLARHMRADKLEADQEARERADKLAEIQRRHEDAQTLMMLRGEEPPTLASRFADFAALDELAELNAKRTREAEAKARAEQQERRIAELEAQVAAEQLAHSRTSSRYHEAVEGWGRERQRNRSSEQGHHQPRQYFRSGGAIIGGPY